MHDQLRRRLGQMLKVPEEVENGGGDVEALVEVLHREPDERKRSAAVGVVLGDGDILEQLKRRLRRAHTVCDHGGEIMSAPHSSQH